MLAHACSTVLDDMINWVVGNFFTLSAASFASRSRMSPSVWHLPVEWSPLNGASKISFQTVSTVEGCVSGTSFFPKQIFPEPIFGSGATARRELRVTFDVEVAHK